MAYFGARYFGPRYFGPRYWGGGATEEEAELAEHSAPENLGAGGIAGKKRTARHSYRSSFRPIYETYKFRKKIDELEQIQRELLERAAAQKAEEAIAAVKPQLMQFSPLADMVDGGTTVKLLSQSIERMIADMERAIQQHEDDDEVAILLMLS